MTLLELWVKTPLAQSVGLALAHSLWEGVLIAVALAAALCVARSSRARYAAACAAMLLMLASFAVTLVRLVPQPVDVVKAPRVSMLAAVPPPALPMIPTHAPSSPTLAALLPWIALFWVAGVLFFHLRSLGGWVAARRLRLAGVCPAPSEWQQRLDGLTARLRVSKTAVLLESCLADVPVVIGYLRPVILMPVGLLAGLPMSQVDAILIHELAHIRRQDYLVNLLQTVVEGLLFYHPAVWWISSVIRAERENCCDDLAVAVTGDARQYAAALAALEQNRWAAHELALAATGGSLVKRIRRLLQQPERPSAAWTPVFSAGLLVAGAGIALASWQTTPAPKPQVPVVAASTAPAAPVAPVVELPQAAPLKKRTPVTIAQVQQAAPIAQAAAQEKAAPMATPYRKWLNEDVAYIITDEERKAYKAAASDDDRENLIARFWTQRDPTPGTPQNEFKDEHYRRIAYTNDHFTTASGLPGWKTDRGRIYITFGPPDEIEDHSAGGLYIRPTDEGGGTTTTYPFQQWRYRLIEGVGKNVIIEFVDTNKAGDFRMTTDPSEKSSVLRVPAASLTMMEQMGLSDKVRSFDAGNIFGSVGDGQKTTVSVTPDKFNTNIRVALPSEPAKYDVITQIVDVNNRAVANGRDITTPGQSTFTMHFTIRPGSYTLKVLVREPGSGKIETSQVSFYVN